MHKDIPWEILEAEDIAVDRFKIKKEVVRLSNRKEQNFSYIRFANGVCVLAVTKENQVVILNQYRHAVGRWEAEFPAGMIDEGEEPLEAAKRELLEETGYQAANWLNLGFFHPSPGSTSEVIHLFAAADAYQTAQPDLEQSEEIEMELLSMDQLHRLVNQGEFRHGGGLAALLKYQLSQ